MNARETYTLAMVLSALDADASRRELCSDIAVELALRNDFTFEERLGMRDAAEMVLRTRHPEVEMLDAVRIALDCCLSQSG